MTVPMGTREEHRRYWESFRGSQATGIYGSVLRRGGISGYWSYNLAESLMLRASSGETAAPACFSFSPSWLCLAHNTFPRAAPHLRAQGTF